MQMNKTTTGHFTATILTLNRDIGIVAYFVLYGIRLLPML